MWLVKRNNKRIIGKSWGIVWKLKRVIGEVLGNRGIELIIGIFLEIIRLNDN